MNGTQKQNVNRVFDMPKIIDLKCYTDILGSLTVIDKILPFDIQRVYYIYNASGVRGGHRHKKTIQALICVAGCCDIFVNDGIQKETFILDSPNKCLLLYSQDWHTMQNFSKDAVLLVLASEHYDKNDYIDEEYS